MFQEKSVVNYFGKFCHRGNPKKEKNFNFIPQKWNSTEKLVRGGLVVLPGIPTFFWDFTKFSPNWTKITKLNENYLPNSTKITKFDENYQIWRKLPNLTKIQEDHQIWRKLPNLTKITTFDENYQIWRRSPNM